MITADDIKNTVDSMKYTISSIETILEQKDSVEGLIADSKKELEELDKRILFLADTKTFYIKAVDLMYEESIGALKETLNTALQYVITDKDYSCNLTLEDKRGTKNLFITLIDNEQDLEVDLKHSVGQGVRAVISAVLKVYYLLNKDSHLLFLDEKYSVLSDQYIPRFFAFLKRLCDEKGLTVTIITHDNRFFDYADRVYMVSDGNVQLVDNMGKDDIVLEQEEKE